MCDRTPDHLEYDSPMLADNAKALHVLEQPSCPGINAFPCGDHYHIGHPKPSMGRECRDRHADYYRGVPRERDTLPLSP